MTKQIIISVAAAALIAIPAQSASAAISKPVGPVAQEMDHGVAPTLDHGVGTSPGTSAPEATESVPTPAEQGISTSPGSVEPVTEPSDPEATSGDEKDEEGDADDCAVTQDLIDAHEGAAKLLLAAGSALFDAGHWGFGGLLLDARLDSLHVAEDNRVYAEESGCYDGDGEAAQ